MSEDTEDRGDIESTPQSKDRKDEEDIDSGLTTLMEEEKKEIIEKLEAGEHPFKEAKKKAAKELAAKDWKIFFEPRFSERFKGEALEEEAQRVRTHLRSLWDLSEVESVEDLEAFCRTFESEEEENVVEWKVAKNLEELASKERTKIRRLISERTESLDDYPGKMKQSDIQDDIEEKASNLSSDEDSDTTLESVETEEDITEALEIAETEIELNPSTQFKVEELEMEVLDLSRNSQGVVFKTNQWNLYEIKLGEGSEQEELNLVSRPSRKLPEGKCWKPIRFLKREDDREIFEDLYRGMDIDKPLENFMHAAEGEYLILADSISEESKEKIRELSNEQLKNLVYTYLDDGQDYDSKIRKIMYPLLVKHSREEVTPDQVVRKAPHLLMLTNSSVGKTFIARKVGIRRDSASLAGLIGYASADKVQEGELNQAVTAQLIDEFTRDRKSEETGSGLLSIMEIGIYNNTQAGVNLRTELYAPLAFMTNPEKDREVLSSDDEGDDFSIYLEAFNESIRDLGGNFAALGSRFGVVLFDENLKPAEGNSLPRDKRRKLQSLVNWIIDEIAPQYSKLEEECDWIEEPFSENYQKEIEDLSQSISFEPEFHSFWKSHLEAYRHTKGLALRAAALENLSDLLNDSYSVEEITEDAKNHLEQFKQVNRESLLGMINTTSEEDAKQRKRKTMESEDEYVEYFLRSIISFYSSREEVNPKDRQPIGLLKDEWQDIKENIDGLDKGDRYWRFSKLREQVEKNWNETNSLVKKKYGVRMSLFNGEYFFSVDSKDRFSLLLEGETPLKSSEPETSKSSLSPEQKVFEKTPNRELLKDILDCIPEEGIYEQELIQESEFSEKKISEALNWLESEGLVTQKHGKLKSQDIDLNQILGGRQ